MQTRLIYYCHSALAFDPPVIKHPQKIMRELAAEQGFTLIGAIPQSVFDQWWFWIEHHTKPELPNYIREAAWLPVGSV